MVVESPFTETRAKMWVRVYHALYLRGVEDAHENIDDDGAVREYLEQTWAQNTWGTLQSGVTDRYFRWQYYLIGLAEDMNIGGSMRDFLTVAGRYSHNYFSCATVVALDFYRRGVKDYLDNHTHCDYGKFMKYNRKGRGWFTAKGIKKISAEKIIDEARMMSDLREELDAEQGGKYAIVASKYRAFRRVMSQGTWRTRMAEAKNTLEYM